MHMVRLLLIEFGAIVLALGLLAALAVRFGISPIPLYLLAGLAFGQGGVLPWRPARSSSRPAPRSA